MEELIAPAAPEDLRRELSEATFLFHTRLGNHEAHLVDGRRSPVVLNEIGRLRELTYRDHGSASGKALDLDHLDQDPESPYEQLVIFHPELKRILAATRVKQPKSADDPISSQGIFAFSDAFMRDYYPHILDVGRMFVLPEYQAASAGRQGMFILDNILEAICSVVALKEDLRYFFGRLVGIPGQDPLVRDLSQHYLSRHCPDPDRLLRPKEPLGILTPREELDALLHANDREGDMRILQQIARERESRISGLMRAYLNLSPNMRTFGTAADHDLGGLEETAILVPVEGMAPKQYQRYVVDAGARARANRARLKEAS